MKKVLFENEAIFWWVRETANLKVDYRIYLNGEFFKQTDKTHVRIDGLTPLVNYTILVETVNHNGEILSTNKETFTTLAKKRIIDVTKAPYYAVGDGKTMNTIMLQKALDDCKSTDMVFFPAGVYVTGALNLHSDTEIYISPDAVLQGTKNAIDYLPKIKSRFEGIEQLCYSSLLNMGELNHKQGANCKNIIIRGGGTISGGGRSLAENVIETEKKNSTVEREKTVDCDNENTVYGRARPRLINVSNSENVIIADITVQHGPSWNIHMIYSKNVVTYGCNFYSENVWNGDGWDPDSSEDCTIFDCTFNTGDDCIAIKSGKNPEGNKISRVTKNIDIFDCKSVYGHGVAIGSEVSGGVENVRIWDCDFKDSWTGITLKSHKKRGGYIRNVSVFNSEFSGVLIIGSVWYNQDGESAPTITFFEDLRFENIFLTGKCYSSKKERYCIPPIDIRGYDDSKEYFRDIKFENIYLQRHSKDEAKEISVKDVEDIVFENITFVE